MQRANIQLEKDQLTTRLRNIEQSLAKKNVALAEAGKKAAEHLQAVKNLATLEEQEAALKAEIHVNRDLVMSLLSRR